MEEWKGRRAVITGVKGFLGSRLASMLKGLGAEVAGTDMETDVREKENLLPVFREGDVVFHLAGLANPQYCQTHPLEAFQVNALGTLGVLEAARERGCARVVLASSVHVYGVPSGLPISEAHPVAPVSPYGASKALAESFCAYYSRFTGLHTVVLRFFNIYGAGQKGDYLIPTVLRQLEGGKIEMKDFESKRDYVYVDDAINAFALAGMAETKPGEAFNIGSGKSVSAKDVALMISRISGKNIPVERRESASFVVGASELRADASKAADVLGWKAGVGMEEGISLLLAGSV